MSRLPFFFILTGIIGFVLFQIASLSSLTGWLGEELRSPGGWFHAHLFVLGWATSLAMGAVYQLINVITQSAIYSERLGYVNYVCFTIGLCGLLYGFMDGEIYWIAGSAGLLLIGILLFGWNIGVTLIRARAWNPVTISAACSVLYLVLTGLTGMGMGLNFAGGWMLDAHESLFGAHIWMGTIGWFGLLITGFSYKMLPMFYLAHDYPEKLQTVVLLLWNASVLAGALSFFIDSNAILLRLALLMLVAAVLLYNVHLLQIKRKRHKRHPGSGIQASVYANQAFACMLTLMLVYACLYPDRMLNSGPITVAGWLYLGGWVSFTILSYASKIVPFLWWTHKYGKQAGKPGTPLMAHLLDEKKVRIGLAAIGLASLALLAGLAIGSSTLISLSGTILSLFSIAYMAIIGLVFTR
ncbi:hypothetical protein [Cohnella boryungensis]|uniref:Cbb3-type cytochrome c oxidase subunit I n=1 Tax=Cohnella boryungensis TaxID=768479 RepID=A0ABV8SIM8_9BACL